MLPSASEAIGDGTHLVGETLLLEVQASGAVERGTLRSGREDGGPGRESALHD